MKHILRQLAAIVLGLILTINVASAQILFLPLFGYRPTSQDVADGYTLALQLWQNELRYMHVPPLPPIEWHDEWISDNPWILGSYGRGCVENWTGTDANDLSCYEDPEYLKTIKIHFLSVYDSQRLALLVISHEIGHHILLYSGIKLEDQHGLMERVDEKAVEIIKRAIPE